MMLGFLRNLLVLSLGTLWMTSLTAQLVEPALLFTTQNGLPQIQTSTMIQDSRGFIWIGTKRGLAKYNGSKWTIISTKDKFEMLGEISDGNLVAIVGQSGIGSYYVYNGNKMKSSSIKLFEPDRFNCKIVNDTLFHLNILDSKVYQIDLRKEKLIGEKHIDISSYRLAGHSKKYGLLLREKVDDKYVNLVQLENLKVVKKLNVGAGSFLVENVGIEVFENFEDGYFEFYNYDDFKIIGKVKFNKDLLEDAQFNTEGNFYFGNNSENYRFCSIKKKVEKIKQINSTRNIFLEDLDGNLWNSSESGIQFFPKNYFVEYSQRELSDAWFFYPYDGDYIYGNYTGGLKRVNLKPYSVRAISTDKRNNIYFGPSEMNGKLYIPGSSYISVLDGESLGHIDIRKFNTPLLCSYYDSMTESIYFGGLKSMLKISQNEEIDFYRDEEEVYLSYVLTINRFDDENLILGTRNSLVLFNLESKTYTSISSIFPSENLAGAISLEKDSRGNLWIGNSKGLWHLIPSSKKITRVGEKVIDDYVLSVLEVKENLLAFGTSKNLMYLDLDRYYEVGESYIKAFNDNNGFGGEEISQGGLQLQDSILWVPSATKLVSTNINTIAFTPSFSNIAINSVNKNVLEFGYNQNDVFDLTYGTKDLEIEYEAIGINQATNNSFQYKLIGHEEAWSPWTSETKANFNDIGSGDYEFIVRTRTGSSLGDVFPEESIKLRLEMPFYEEPNFLKNALFLALFLFGLIGLLLYTMYDRMIAKQELDKQFKLLQVQTLQLQLNPHFLFNVLGTIQSLILEKDIDNANKYLVSFSKMIRRYLDYNVSAYKSLEANKIDTIKISLQEEFEILKIYLDFEQLQLADKFSYDIQIDQTIDSFEFQIPPLIIQPLIENCIKHGVVPKKGKSHIQINVSKTDNGIQIYIKDNGIGISRSIELQKSSSKDFKSLSLQLINERIEVLNSMGESISLTINDLPDEGGVEQVIFIDQF